MKKFIRFLILIILFSLTLSFSFQKPTLKLTPQFSQIEKDEIITVNVSVEGLSDNLIGAHIFIALKEAIYSYPVKPEDVILSVIEVKEGDFLKKDGATTFFNYKVENGLIDISMARIGDPASSTGGNLCSIKLKGVNPGNSPLHFALIDLRDYRNQTIEAQGIDGSVIVKVPKIIIRLYIDKKNYYVNDEIKFMDVAPIIREGRTLLPIRYVAEALGAIVLWDAKEEKVTVSFKGTVIELWIGKNSAKVNGVSKLIDETNPKVIPIVIPPGRTMLPIRFIAENLGCNVDWNAEIKEVKITYPSE